MNRHFKKNNVAMQNFYNYKNYLIKIDGIKPYLYSIYQDKKLVFSDTQTIDGGNFQSEKHCLNDAKKNIESLIRIK